MLLAEAIRRDVVANHRNPKAQIILVWFRVAQWLRYHLPPWNPVTFVILVSYRVFVEWILGVELPWKTTVGPGLVIYHGQGLVVNDGTVIGRNVVLRNGVTIGHVTAGGRLPVLEDDVEVGAGAIILGPIRVGRGARIGAGAVVTKDVPAGATVVGNPARVTSSRTDLVPPSTTPK